MSGDELDLSGNLESWISALPSYQSRTISIMLAGREPESVALTWLQLSGPEDTVPLGAVRAGARLFLDRLIEELKILLCSDGDDYYENERQNLLKQAKAGRAALIALIAAALAPHVGASAALIGPPIAIVLALVGRAGQSATCEALQGLISSRGSQLESGSGVAASKPSEPADDST